MYQDDLINDFSQEKECTYKGEHYSVRDNGAIFRHALMEGMPRRLDEIWTFGKKDNKTGYMMYGGHRVHIIIARAFLGEHDSKEYVVDHIDTNRCNNRVENLRWFTKLENVLNNPVTRKKITFLCGGNIHKFLDDPSCLKELSSDYQNLAWMRTVSKEEARNAYERVMHWANKTTISPSNGNKVGEWVYKPFVPFEEGENINAFLNSYKDGERTRFQDWEKELETELEDNTIEENLTSSLTPNAKQQYWNTPTHFPLCPNKIKGDAINEYFQNLAIGKEFCYNNIWRSIIADFAMSEDNEKILIVCDNGENSLKRWVLVQISFEKEHYVHSTLGTYFKQDGAIKYFTLGQGKKWEGGEVYDDLL